MTGPDIDRRSLLGGTAATLGLAMAGHDRAFAKSIVDPSERQAPGKRPNLVLFFLDELRADALSCYGNPVTKTPNFDFLARQGTRFAECHVQNPVCAQSRCSMLTGLPTSVRGHRSLYYLLQPDEPNMFRYLKDSGYDVFWFGKNDALAAKAFKDSVTEWHEGSHMADFAGAGIRAAMAKLDQGPDTMIFPGGGDPKATSDYKLLEMAIEILERPASDKPFCIFLPLSNPHPPYRAPSGFDQMYDPTRLPPLAPAGLPKKPDFFAGIREYYRLQNAPPATFKEVRAIYYGMVGYADWLLGTFMEAMARTGRDHDTALIVSSDHGDYAGDYGLVEKWPSGLESCLTHVPLIARAPGGRAGHVVHEMVELSDLMATFLDLGQTKATHTHFSRSLVPQIRGAAGDADRAAFSEGGYNAYEPQAFEPIMPGFYGPKTKLQNERPATVQRVAGVKTPRYTFIERPHGQSELYDRRNDPKETINLIDDLSHAGTRNAMTKRLADWYIDTTGVPPNVKDARNLPPFPPNPT